MATEYVISFRDNRVLGSLSEIQSLIREHFPSVQFHWTTSGAEKLRLAKERGVELPQEIRDVLNNLPSLLEGVAEGLGWDIMFGLQHMDPLRELIIEPRGDDAAMDAGIRAIEQVLGTSFRVYGEEATE